MKKNGEQSNGDVRSEYNFASMKGGVRGKYYERYRKRGHVVPLAQRVTANKDLRRAGVNTKKTQNTNQYEGSGDC
jgi:hypothetical protein